MMTVRKLDIGNRSVAVVEVEPSLSPPVRFNGQVWVRVGPRRALATADEERRLAERRRAADLPFDSRPAEGATLADLDLVLFEREYLPSVLPTEVLEANNRSTEQRLMSLRLVAPDGTPTPACLRSDLSQPGSCPAPMSSSSESKAPAWASRSSTSGS